MNKKLLIVMTCLGLAACGGSSDSGAGGSPSSGGTGTGGSSGGSGSGTGSGALTQTYEALPPPADPAAFLAQLNAEGAKGFRYVAEQAFSGDGNAAQNIFVKDTGATYTYELLANNATQAGFLAQANQEGARGIATKGR